MQPPAPPAAPPAPVPAAPAAPVAPAAPAAPVAPAAPAAPVAPAAPAAPAQPKHQSTPEVRERLKAVGAIAQAISAEVQKVIIGKSHVIDNVLINILSNGNLLFEDYPGLAKTLMTNTFADALGCDFKRVQFTPDLLPADITGTNIYDAKKGEFTFKPGPLFCNLLLADEINRAPPKTQAALLEAMQEKQVTIGTVTHKLPAPFIVMATQNPVEQEGTYPLPEAQLDRFMFKMSVGYLTVQTRTKSSPAVSAVERTPSMSMLSPTLLVSSPCSKPVKMSTLTQPCACTWSKSFPAPVKTLEFSSALRLVVPRLC